MSIEDIAQDVELQQWELNQQRGAGPLRVGPEHPSYGPEECDECGGEMPDARRAYTYRLCVHCQTALEARRARGITA